MPAPNTGSVVTSKMLTTAIDHEMRQKLSTLIPALFAKCSDTRNVIAPNSELNPSTCRNNTAILTAADELKSIPVSG